MLLTHLLSDIPLMPAYLLMNNMHVGKEGRGAGMLGVGDPDIPTFDSDRSINFE